MKSAQGSPPWYSYDQVASTAQGKASIQGGPAYITCTGLAELPMDERRKPHIDKQCESDLSHIMHAKARKTLHGTEGAGAAH